MMKRPPITDAEFEVVSPPRDQPIEYEAPQKWNGLGPPPEWGEWNWYARAFYVVAMAVMLAGVGVVAHRLVYGAWLP